jgi:hypothetical protein
MARDNSLVAAMATWTVDLASHVPPASRLPVKGLAENTRWRRG